MRLRYNTDLLNKYKLDLNLEVSTNICNKKLNRDSLLEYKCSVDNCNNIHKSSFRNSIRNNFECKYHININKQKNICLSKNIKSFDNKFRDYIDKHKIIIINIPDNIKRSTKLNGICNCGGKFNKTANTIIRFEETGAKCTECVKIIQNKKTKETYGKKTEKEITDIRLKTRETQLQNKTSKNFRDVFNELKEIDKENKLKLENYNSLNLTLMTTIKGRCYSCSENIEDTCSRYLIRGIFCRTCSNKNGIIKQQNTNINKYGVKCTLNSKESIIKKKETSLKNWGTEHHKK